MSRHYVERVNFNPGLGDEKIAYGVSVKWWPANKPYFIPRIYDAPVWQKRPRRKKIHCNRLVIGWLKCTIVFYWPSNRIKEWIEDSPELIKNEN